MATWIFRNTVCQIWLADLKEGETRSSTDLKGQRVSTPRELPSPAAYLSSFSLPSAACQHYNSAADWQVLVRVMLSTETQQPKASRTHLDWGGQLCLEKQDENAQSEMQTKAGTVAWEHWCGRKLWGLDSQLFEATRLKLFFRQASIMFPISLSQQLF